MVGTAYAAVPLVTVLALVTLAAVTIVLVRLLGLGLREGYYPVRSRVGWQVWATERLLDQARTLLFPIYASLVTPWWLRALGAKVGRDVEASTVLLLPSMTTVADGAFLADDTMVAGYELARGWVHIAPAKIGKRAFLGNSGMTAPGRRVPKHGLVAVLSTAPQKSKPGSSWLGSPPVRLRRPPQGSDDERTFAPPLRLKVIRGLVELCRIVPVMVTVAIATSVLIALQWLVERRRPGRSRGPRRCRPHDRRGRRRRRDDAGEVGRRRPHRCRRAPAVELVRLAQRGRRHVRRDGRRSVVRVDRDRHARHQRLAAQPRGTDRPRCLV